MSPPRTAPDPGARDSLRARFRAGPIGRRIARFDVAVFRFVRRDLQSPVLDGPLRTLTTAGEHAALWHVIALGGAVLDRRHREQWLRASAAVGAAQLVNVTLKTVVRRRRPEHHDLPALVAVPTSLSFPSSHAASSFAAATALRPLLPPHAPLRGVAAAIAFSRIYFGVHYPTDIAVGAGIGTLVGRTIGP